ncbi:MAG: cyclic nucleotide-binding domain-containing protein [Anaerolineales bacterium]|nr:MAG: cyclic nucleotide-binding domain-containing protein [Anaerolineales bacterium]
MNTIFLYNGDRSDPEVGMEHSTILEAVELFEGATPQEISSVAALCQERTFAKGDIVTAQGDPGDELFVVCEGFVEVLRAGVPPEQAPRTVVHLGAGQIFGEMALVDRGPRSATVKAAADETRVLVIQQDAFERLCEQNHHLGYIVMRNIAADLSFKLRHHHLTGR